MRLLIIPALLSLSLACVEDVGTDRVKARVEDVPAEQLRRAADPSKPAAPPIGKITPLKVDPEQSSIRALAAKITAKHPIDFKTFSGKVGLVQGKLATISYEVVMKDMVADHPKLTTHLLDADFFDVGKYPTSTFVSAKITEGSATEGMTHTVSGDFMIHGITKRLTFPAKIDITDSEVRASTEFVIDRNDFGMTYAGRADDLIQDNVRMNIELVSPRK